MAGFFACYSFFFFFFFFFSFCGNGTSVDGNHLRRRGRDHQWRKEGDEEEEEVPARGEWWRKRKKTEEIRLSATIRRLFFCLMNFFRFELRRSSLPAETNTEENLGVDISSSSSSLFSSCDFAFAILVTIVAIRSTKTKSLGNLLLAAVSCSFRVRQPWIAAYLHDDIVSLSRSFSHRMEYIRTQ